MLKKGLLEHKGFLFWGDLYSTVKAFFIAHLLIGGISGIKENLLEFSVFLSLVLSLWILSFLSKNAIYVAQVKLTRKLFKELFWVVLKPLVLLFVFTLLFLRPKNPFLFFLIFGFLDLLFLVAYREIHYFFFRYLRSKGFLTKNILVLGTHQWIKNFLREVNLYDKQQFKILGILEKDESRKGQRYLDVPVLGSINLFESLLKNCHVDSVVFAFPRKISDWVHKSVLLCQKMGVKGYLYTDACHPIKGSKRALLPQKLIRVTSSFQRGFPYLLKSLVDRTAALVLIVLTSPLLILISIVIKLSSKGPVFFKQKRCGLNGKRFLMYKFRTMIEDAESQKKYLISENEMDGAAFKIKDDPRITEVGKLLRKFSLDEAPQFFNVLWGDMSLVGPRPPLPEEVSQYKSWQRKRLSVKPGITCLWQINGRNEVSFEDWMRMDLEYIKNWSLRLDFKILLKTLPAVISARGAR